MADPWPLAHAEREALADDGATGSGPEVPGPLLSLIMARTGRRAALDGLSGERLPVLCERG